jgi:O-antigen ligase
MLSKNIYFYSFLLISLMPIFLVTGPFLADLSVVILNIFFFYIIFKEKKFQYIKNKYFIIFIIFSAYLILRSFFTISFEVSLKSVLFYSRFIVFSLMVFLTIQNYPNFIKNFSIIFLLIFNFILFDSIFQFFFGKDIFGIASMHPTRTSGPFGDELVLGSFLSRFSPFLLFFFYYIQKPLKYFFLFTFLLGFVVTLLSAERTGSIFYIISILFFLSFSKKFIKIKIFFIILSLVAAFFVLSVDNKKTRIITQAMQNSKVGENFIWISVMHDAHIKTAFNMFKQNPFYGVGPKMFRYECSKKRYEITNPPHPRSNELRCSTHPHNLLIQLMAETGLIGMIGYLVIFFYVVFQLIKEFINGFKSSSNLKINYRVFFLLSFFLTLIPIAPSGNFFNNWISIVFYFPLGFYLYFNKNRI